MTQLLVRAIFRSVRIKGLRAPHDTAHVKIYYPGLFNGSESERDTGVLPARADGPLLPIVILLPGINVGPEGLSGLAHALCARGFVVVTYSLIGEEFPGHISLTPGIDMTSLTPDTFGTRPSALALGPIIDDLTACDKAGVLAGRLDLNKIAFGGHSAGGTVALLNANPAWFKGTCAAFAYGAHTAAASLLGHPQGSMNAICDKIPILIMGGTQDGVIAASACRYGDIQGDATGRVVATFERAVTRKEGDSLLVLIKGANHFSIISPHDTSTGRAFLDWPETAHDAFSLIDVIIWAFLAKAMDLPGADKAWQHIDRRQDEIALLTRK